MKSPNLAFGASDSTLTWRASRQQLKDLHLAFASVETALRAAQVELAGSDTPQLDAEVLLAFVTNRTRTQLRSAPERLLTDDEYERFRQLTARRNRGEPIAYLTGTREFWSLTLHVDATVLVPRPETELLVERSLLHIMNPSARILDLGTGSGAIALAVASERPASDVLATDASSAALEIAQRNACELGLGRIRFQLSDWFSNLGNEQFDVIASNPPYIAAGDPQLAADVLAYEPRRALIAGTTGLEAIAVIITTAPRHLQQDGWLIVEHGIHQAPQARRLLEQAGFTSVASHADLAGIERVSEGQWCGSR